MSNGFMTVAKVGEIPEGGIRIVRVDGQAVALVHAQGAYYALEDACTHDGGTLEDAVVDGLAIECPRHGARFDLRTGAVLALPATAPIPVHEVRVTGDEIQVACELCEERRFPAAMGAATAPRGPVSADATGARPPARSPLESPPAAEAAATEARRGPTQQEFAIRAALETVMDPEIQLSVVDLGLLREIVVEPGRTRIRMLLTTPFCPYAPQLSEDVRQAAMSVVPQPCEVEILPDAWSPELMPDPSLLGYSM